MLRVSGEQLYRLHKLQVLRVVSGLRVHLLCICDAQHTEVLHRVLEGE